MRQSEYSEPDTDYGHYTGAGGMTFGMHILRADRSSDRFGRQERRRREPRGLSVGDVDESSATDADGDGDCCGGATDRDPCLGPSLPLPFLSFLF